jgi:hypothetical protein
MRWLAGVCMLLCALGAWGDIRTTPPAVALTPAGLPALRPAWSVPFFQADPAKRFEPSAFDLDAKHRIFIAATRPTAAGGTTASTLCAYDAASGTQLWVVAVPNTAGAPQFAFTAPAAGAGIVYTGLGPTVAAYVAASGQPVWQADAGVGAVRTLYILAPDLLFVTGETGASALSPSTGATLFTTALLNAGRPALDGGKLYVSSVAGLHVVDAKTGAVQTIMPPQGAGSGLLMRGSTLFYQTPAAVYAINTATKKLAWKYPLAPAGPTAQPPTVPEMPFLLAGNLLCVGDAATGRTVAVQAGTGARAWEAKCEALSAGTPLAATGGLLFVADKQGTVLDPATGSVLGKISPLCSAPGWRALRLTPDGTALVGVTTQGNLHVFAIRPASMPPRKGEAMMR